MNFVKMHTTEDSFHCECCGSITNYKIEVEIFDNEDKLTEHIFYHDNHLGDSNWNGEKISVWAYLLKELEYKIKFNTSLELYPEAIDFIPEVPEFYKDQSLEEINVQVVYERDFYSVGKGKTEFIDRPKKFHINFAEKPIMIEGADFEEIYELVVKNLSHVSQFNVNPDLEFQEQLEY